MRSNVAPTQLNLVSLGIDRIENKQIILSEKVIDRKGNEIPIKWSQYFRKQQWYPCILQYLEPLLHVYIALLHRFGEFRNVVQVNQSQFPFNCGWYHIYCWSKCTCGMVETERHLCELIQPAVGCKCGFDIDFLDDLHLLLPSFGVRCEKTVDSPNESTSSFIHGTEYEHRRDTASSRL